MGNQRAPPQSFMLSLISLNELSILDTAFGSDGTSADALSASKFTMKYHVTLYCNDPKSKSNFYGRTYISEERTLEMSRTGGNMFESNQEDFIYFHTSYRDAK